jgi:hypothetical protein
MCGCSPMTCYGKAKSQRSNNYYLKHRALRPQPGALLRAGRGGFPRHVPGGSGPGRGGRGPTFEIIVLGTLGLNSFLAAVMHWRAFAYNSDKDSKQRNVASQECMGKARDLMIKLATRVVAKELDIDNLYSERDIIMKEHRVVGHALALSSQKTSFGLSGCPMDYCVCFQCCHKGIGLALELVCWAEHRCTSSGAPAGAFPRESCWCPTLVLRFRAFGGGGRRR